MPKSSNEIRTPDRLEPAQLRGHGWAVIDQERFRDLDFQSGWRQDQDSSQALPHDGGDIGGFELHRRTIDRDAHDRRGPGDVGAGAFENPSADRHDEAGFLGDRDELRRRDIRQAWTTPAQQSLESDGFLAARAFDRLIENAKFVALDRETQSILDHDLALHGLMHIVVKEAEASLAF